MLSNTFLIFSSQNSFYALYRSFTECVFVEEDGDIIFYKNARGEAAREVADGVLETEKSLLVRKDTEGSETDVSSDSEEMVA